MKKLKNYLDVVQGSLTVIAYAPPVKGRLAWLCRCDCGNELVITQNRLGKGVTRCDPARHMSPPKKVGRS